MASQTYLLRPRASLENAFILRSERFRHPLRLTRSIACYKRKEGTLHLGPSAEWYGIELPIWCYRSALGNSHRLALL